MVGATVHRRVAVDHPLVASASGSTWTSEGGSCGFLQRHNKLEVQCDQIGRLIALWATFFSKSPTFSAIFVKVKSILGNFYRHLGTFYGSHWLERFSSHEIQLDVHDLGWYSPCAWFNEGLRIGNSCLPYVQAYKTVWATPVVHLLQCDKIVKLYSMCGRSRYLCTRFIQSIYKRTSQMRASMEIFRRRISVWPEKNRQMSIKVAQN